MFILNRAVYLALTKGSRSRCDPNPARTALRQIVPLNRNVMLVCPSTIELERIGHNADQFI
jgi:hypothetical protein